MFILFGIVIGLNMLGAGALLGAVLGGAGVVGLALGFAMKDTIENYVSSLMLSLRQPFRANDKVKIDDYEGRVLRLTTRATILLTPEGNHLRLSNSTVFKAVIVNYTAQPAAPLRLRAASRYQGRSNRRPPLRARCAEGARFRPRPASAQGGGQGRALPQHRHRVSSAGSTRRRPISARPAAGRSAPSRVRWTITASPSRTRSRR